MLIVLDPAIEEWLDEETEIFVENELKNGASWHLQFLEDACGNDDLFEPGRVHREWWDEQIRSHREALLRSLSSSANNWHEDFELESRRLGAFLDGTALDLL